jgi:hypothetical protein
MRWDRAWETSAPPRLLAPRPPVAAARQPRSRASAFKEAGRPRDSWDHRGARTHARAGRIEQGVRERGRSAAVRRQERSSCGHARGETMIRKCWAL